MRYLSLTICVLIALNANCQLFPFNPNDQPPAPDYSKPESWSSLPFRLDAADAIPTSETWVNDSLKQVDVFYIYPTIYISGTTWNEDLANKALNKKIDNKPVRYQASVFNADCRVYVPRYRQAILASFFKDKENGKKALDFAYEDVKRAFQYYLDHYNHGRPIIIASHSQGSRHARQLLADFFDGKPLQKQLVAAYVVGFGINDTMYKSLKPCDNPTETGCYITWASFKDGFNPGSTPLVGNVCVNPITWNRDTIAIDASKSLGGMLLNFNREYHHASSAQVHNGYLWVKTDIPFIRSFRIMHIGDYNLFWYDIRANVKQRVDAFLKEHPVSVR